MTPNGVNYASVASFERAKGGLQPQSGTRAFTMVLMAVFFIVLMIGMAAGVTMYKKVATDQLAANESRIQAGLLANTVRANDTDGALSVGQGPEGRALVLTKVGIDGDKYETRLYLYQGNIMQEYAVEGAAYAPSRAEALIESGTFEFSLEDGLLVVTTDHGSTGIALRTEQEDLR